MKDCGSFTYPYLGWKSGYNDFVSIDGGQEIQPANPLTAASRIRKPIRDVPGEPYIIMWFSPDNTEHTQRFADIDRDPEVLRWMVPAEPSPPQDLDETIRGTHGDPEHPQLVFAIADRQQNVVGMVQYYLDEEDRIGQLREQVEIPNNALILETSFAKLFGRRAGGQPEDEFFVSRGVPEEGLPGVAVNGMKQTLEIIPEMEERISKAAGKKPRPVVITAYTNPANVASELVLRKNGFELLPQTVSYEGEDDNAWVKRI